MAPSPTRWWRHDELFRTKISIKPSAEKKLEYPTPPTKTCVISNRNFQLSLVFHTYLIFYENKRTLLICCEQVDPFLSDQSISQQINLFNYA